METDCSEQAYFLELHGLDIKGFAQVNTGALVSSTHYERDDSNWNPPLSTSRIWTCWETSFSFLRKKVSPLPLNSETQTSGQKVADSGGNSVELIKA